VIVAGNPATLVPGQAGWPRLRRATQILRRRPSVAIGLGVVLVLALLALLAPWVAPYPAEQADPEAILASPSANHVFGTDINGMDIFSRLLWGGRIDLVIAGVVTSVALFAGILLGSWLGYFAGRGGVPGAVGDFVMRGFDALQAFPFFVFALALVAIVGRNVTNIVLVLLFLQTPYFMRLTRSAVLRTREEAFVDAARCAGNSELRVVLRHVLPNSLTPALVNASVVAGGTILLTAGLSFVGAGVQAPRPEWGYMVSVGADSLYTGQWWPALIPGAWIGATVLAFALLGEGVREFVEPGRR
jgi:peptide/nickel transport system permease protein